ncbi:MAG: hypothetical protein GY794_04875 [bacterium]|nr:hypothetical protein [bacterium]
MKNYLVILVAGVILCVLVGCDPQTTEEPVSYDRDVDGPPTVVMTSMADYDVIGSPKDVRKRREALREATVGESSGGDAPSGREDPSGPSTPASDDEIAEVKAVIEKILATKDSGDESAAIACFDEEAAAAVQEITQATKAIQAKAPTLNSLMETKFGQQYPDSVEAKIAALQSAMVRSSSAAEILGEVSVDQLVFTKIGDKVVVTSPKGDKYILSKTEDVWKIGFDENARKGFVGVREILKGSTKMIDALSAGVKDGSITADNVEAKAAELEAQHVAPAMKIMAGAGAKPGGGGDGR